MGRAQVVQAQACRLEPDVRMNPILLKPNSDTGCQVIVRGKPVGNMGVAEYVRYKPQAFAAAKACYDSLAAEFDAVILEGAGSPGEVNLKSHDIVNMRMAALRARAGPDGRRHRPRRRVRLLRRHDGSARRRGNARWSPAGWSTASAATPRCWAPPSTTPSRTRAGPSSAWCRICRSSACRRRTRSSSRAGALDDRSRARRGGRRRRGGPAAHFQLHRLRRAARGSRTCACASSAPATNSASRTPSSCPGARTSWTTWTTCAGAAWPSASWPSPARDGRRSSASAADCSCSAAKSATRTGSSPPPAATCGLGLLNAVTTMASEKTLARAEGTHAPSGCRVVGYEIHHGATTAEGNDVILRRNDGEAIGFARERSADLGHVPARHLRRRRLPAVVR